MINYIKEYELAEVKENVCFSNYLTMKTKANIKYLIEPKCINSLRIIIKKLNELNLNYFILGNGSNTICKSKIHIDYVINMNSLKNEYEIKNNILRVTGSYSMPSLAIKLAKEKYKGLEFLSSIPGTIGAGIAMNCGAYKKEIKDVLISCKCINKKGQIINYHTKDLDFEYRNSLIRREGLIVIEALFNIEKTNLDILSKINEWKEYRNKTQPLEYPSSGSIFKNLNNISAWEVIDKINLRGYQIGGAMFSNKHSNFIINYNNAKGEDIEKLINIAKEKAKELFNINLQEEIIILS